MIRLTIQHKYYQTCYSNEQSTESRRTGPGVSGASPGEPNKEKNTSSDEEKNADKVELLEHLPLCLSFHMQLGVSRWMIEEMIEDSRNDRKNEADIVAPSPALTGVLDQQPGDDRAKDSKGERGHEDDCDYHAAVLVGHELAQDDTKGQLAGCRETIEDIGNNQHLNVCSSCPYYAANDRQYHGPLHNPLSTKYIRQPADEQKPDAAGKGPDGGNPVDIGGIAQLGVDQGEGIGGQNPAQVGHDGS